MRDHVLWPVPWPIRVFVGSMIYRNTTATLHGQGTGRFSADEIALFRKEIWESFADLLLESQVDAQEAERLGAISDGQTELPSTDEQRPERSVWGIPNEPAHPTGASSIQYEKTCRDVCRSEFSGFHYQKCAVKQTKIY